MVTRNINRWISKTSVTHLLLDGGTLSAKEGFHDDYVSDILNGERLCVVEKKTSQFRFFVDIDYVGTEELDFAKVATELAKIVNAGPCVLAKAEPRETPKGTKYGVHLVWPESVVNKPRANSIRMRILDEFGPDWEHIIDASVYSGSGLRMLWSYKNEHDSTPYVPWGRIDESGNFREFKNRDPSRHFLDLFSIRISSSDDVTHLVSASPSSSSHEDLENFIRRNIPGQEKARVTRVGKCKNKKDYWVRTDSRYCDHVKREHKSNHVWFVLSPKGFTIGQMCEDEECKNWKGRLYRIPSRLIPNEGVLDSGSCSTIADYLPDGWRLNFQGHN